MNNIFENAFVCDKWKDEQVPLIIEELEPIPRPLLKYMFDNGFKIYVPKANNIWFLNRNNMYMSWNDKRSIFETSYGSVDVNRPHVSINQNINGFIKNEHPHSVPLHETMHVMDAMLDLHKDLPQGKPLDWYADKNMFEKFAVAGEAFCHTELFVSKDYRTHNKLELYQKSPEIFKYFEQFFREWERRSV